MPRRPLRRRVVLLGVAIAVVAVLVAAVAIKLLRPGTDGLPDRFATGTLMTPSEQYRHQLASKVPAAGSYQGKSEDYRTYLKHAALAEFDVAHWPVVPSEALYGSYDYRQTNISGDLIFFSFDRQKWTTPVQQRTTEVVMGNGWKLYPAETRCAGSDDANYFQYCQRITADGFWLGTTRSAGDAIEDLSGLRQADIAAEMAKLQELPQ